MLNELQYKEERAKILSALIRSIEEEIKLSKTYNLSWDKISELNKKRESLAEELIKIKIDLNENTSQLLID